MKDCWRMIFLAVLLSLLSSSYGKYTLWMVYQFMFIESLPFFWTIRMSNILKTKQNINNMFVLRYCFSRLSSKYLPDRKSCRSTLLNIRFCTLWKIFSKVITVQTDTTINKAHKILYIISRQKHNRKMYYYFRLQIS